MAVLKRTDLRNQLKRREISPVYVLFGQETFLRDIAAKTIADLVFNERDLRDFNEDEFSLSVEGNLRTAIAAAEQLPMMATKRVVRICDVKVSATGVKDTLKEDEEDFLAAYLNNPSPSAVVIFIADELNGVRKLGKLLREKAAAFDFEKLDDGELLTWAGDKFRERGVAADDAAIRHLVALVGPGVRRLTTEIDKLSTAALPDTVVTFDLIESLVPNSREIDNFQLTNLLLTGEREKALLVLKKQLDDGAEPVMLLGMLSYHFRRLLMAKDMMTSGADRGEVAKVVKLRYSDQEPFLAAARRADAGKLRTVIEKLAETDVALKTSLGGGAWGPRMQIETLVCQILLS